MNDGFPCFDPRRVGHGQTVNDEASWRPTKNPALLLAHMLRLHYGNEVCSGVPFWWPIERLADLADGAPTTFGVDRASDGARQQIAGALRAALAQLERK